MSARRFPPPWTVEEEEWWFCIRDHDGQQLAYAYFDSPRSSAKPLSKDRDVLQDAKLYDYPSSVVDKIPALKGTQYTFDIKGQILIVSSADRRIVAVV